ncbi:transcriptional regulator [Salmonella enterica subsp. enterica serovar Saintpaul]|nr:transcriptional regulator [Salmonella enterica subsp. enterica serovar Saintpaul]
MYKGELIKFHPGVPGYLSPGGVHLEHFRLLANISGIRSEKILIALESFLVRGLTRQQSCELAGVSPASISVKLRQMQGVNRAVIELQPWYSLSDAD